MGFLREVGTVCGPLAFLAPQNGIERPATPAADGLQNGPQTIATLVITTPSMFAIELVQFGGFGAGLFEKRNIRVGVFPNLEEF